MTEQTDVSQRISVLAGHGTIEKVSLVLCLSLSLCPSLSLSLSLLLPLSLLAPQDLQPRYTYNTKDGTSSREGKRKEIGTLCICLELFISANEAGL